MAKKEVKTDLWVYDLLKQAEISLDAQGSNIKEIDEADVWLLFWLKDGLAEVLFSCLVVI